MKWKESRRCGWIRSSSSLPSLPKRTPLFRFDPSHLFVFLFILFHILRPLLVHFVKDIDYIHVLGFDDPLVFDEVVQGVETLAIPLTECHRFLPLGTKKNRALFNRDPPGVLKRDSCVWRCLGPYNPIPKVIESTKRLLTKKPDRFSTQPLSNLFSLTQVLCGRFSLPTSSLTYLP